MTTDAIKNDTVEVTDKDVEILSNVISFGKDFNSIVQIFLIRNGLAGLNAKMYGFDTYSDLIKHIYFLITILDKFLVAARIGFETDAEFSAKYSGHFILMKALSLYSTYIQISALGLQDTDNKGFDTITIAHEDKILELIKEATLLLVENINDLPTAI